MANVDEENGDNEIWRLRRINQVTKQQCVRLIQLAAATLGISTQLSGCSSGSGEDAPTETDNKEATWAMRIHPVYWQRFHSRM